MSHQQLHKRLTTEQVTAILENYLSGEIKAKEAMSNLGLKKSQFFNLVSKYENQPSNFSIQHQGNYGNRGLAETVEKKIIGELKLDQKLIVNKNIPVKHYNYSATKETLEEKYGFTVSLPTIINRAKKYGYCCRKTPKKIHDREVLTNLAGELAQHDSSHHLWSPYMKEKLYLITTIDDYSRLLLYAELVERESVWAHISALKSVFLQYGCPLKYYADQHSIFRFVKDRDKNSPWRNYTKFTDDVDPQWKQVLKECKVTSIYALSPQAKGKVERPYRWLQDRIVRTAAKEHITDIQGLRAVLKDLVNKYNTKWVHSTTKEIPIFRFENAIRSKKSLFTQLKLAKDRTVDDIFCLRVERLVDSYRKVSVNGFELPVPNGVPRQKVELKIAPDDRRRKLIKIRFWQEDMFLGEITERMENLPIVRF